MAAITLYTMIRAQITYINNLYDRANLICREYDLLGCSQIENQQVVLSFLIHQPTTKENEGIAPPSISHSPSEHENFTMIRKVFCILIDLQMEM